MKRFLVLCLVSPLFACTADVPEAYDFADPPQASELDSAEVQTLPPDTEEVHQQPLSVAIDAASETPGTVFDSPDTVGIVDVEDETGDPLAVHTIAYQALLKYGLHPRASDGLRAAGVDASRIVQTIGNAAASAGTHAQDGTFNGHPYSAATDLSVRGMTDTQIRALLERLGKQGFAAWYRHTGYDGWYGVNHIHAVYANCRMKDSLRNQVRSWLAGRNGLVSNTTYRFHTFSAEAKATVHAKFMMSASGTSNSGGGVGGRVSTNGASLNVRATPSGNANVIGGLANGTYFAIHCQVRGATMTGRFGTSNLWDRVDGGFVTDTYVSTGSDGQVAPTCNGY